MTKPIKLNLISSQASSRRNRRVKTNQMKTKGKKPDRITISLNSLEMLKS
jgi:hypothetical protein